jgi:hypothetical protein
MGSRSAHWEPVRTLEDALALLHAIEERRAIIAEQLWNEGDLQAAYVEAAAMETDIERFRTALSQQWEELFTNARQEDSR